jgi:hypothetical protein
MAEQAHRFQNFSFGTATVDLQEKAGFRSLFPRACGKTIGFWNRLNASKKTYWHGGQFRVIIVVKHA